MRLWIGRYREQGGMSLYPLAQSNPLMLGDPVAVVANASFGVYSSHQHLAYFVDEQGEGRVGAWRRDRHGWSLVATCSNGGALPSYLSLSPDGSSLAVANYGSGNGPDVERRDGPHAIAQSSTRMGPPRSMSIREPTGSIDMA